MSELNPYEVLGVRRNAAERTIKDAYRRLSKVYHPDAGGPIDQFTALAAAYAILSDAPRRAWFDEHGWDRGPMEAIHQAARSCLSAHVQAMLMQDQEPSGDLVLAIRRVVSDQLNNQKVKAIGDHDRVMGRIKRMTGRFKVKRGAPTTNVLEPILEGHKREVEMSLRKLRIAILVNEEVLRVLGDYTFDQQPTTTPTLLTWSQAYGSSGTSAYAGWAR